MKTLSEYNNEFLGSHHAPQESGNNIACPTCGKELFDSSPNIVLTSNPPQYNVHCRECGFKGYRY